MCKILLILRDNKSINKMQSFLLRTLYIGGKGALLVLEFKVVLKYFLSYKMCVCVCVHAPECFLRELGGNLWCKAQNFILKFTLSIPNLACPNRCCISVTLKDPFCRCRILSIWDVRWETVLLCLILCPSAFAFYTH